MLRIVKNPKTIIRIGYAAMIPAGLSRWFLHPGAHLTENMKDGLQGFLYGIAIGAMMLGIWMQGRAKAKTQSGCA